MEKEKALQKLIDLTNRNAGLIPTTPSEFNSLIYRIKNRTHQEISLSSIKRIWGYVPYENFPSKNILNILSRFNGYANWDDFISHSDEKRDPETSDYFYETMITVDSLSKGQILQISWGNEKGCVLEYMSNYIFIVKEAYNIKLKPHDTLRLHTLCVGLPFYSIDIKRGEKIIPGYIGAKKRGITSIKILNQK